jgi:hypothetical protein
LPTLLIEPAKSPLPLSMPTVMGPGRVLGRVTPPVAGEGVSNDSLTLSTDVERRPGGDVGLLFVVQVVQITKLWRIPPPWTSDQTAGILATDSTGPAGGDTLPAPLFHVGSGTS